MATRNNADAPATKPDAPKPEPDAGSGEPRPELLSHAELAQAVSRVASEQGAAAARATLVEAGRRIRSLDAALTNAQNAATEQGAEFAAPGEMPLMLEGIVHVMRNGKLHEIKGPRLVHELDLTQDEIDELTALRVIRLATLDEVMAAQK